MAIAAAHNESRVGIDLYWLPVGASARFVRLGAVMFEAMAAGRASRRRVDLYHAALEVRTPESRFVVELAPYIWGAKARACRGVVVEGPVGSLRASRARLFRYEVRCWRDGVIVAAEHAIESPVRVSDDPDAARRILDLVPSVPLHTWGRDELGLGEMWTSNSVISWLLVQACAGAAGVQPPPGGRAPGWEAGLHVAAWQGRSTSTRVGVTGDAQLLSLPAPGSGASPAR
jgi:hypothetical protein